MVQELSPTTGFQDGMPLPDSEGYKRYDGVGCPIGHLTNLEAQVVSQTSAEVQKTDCLRLGLRSSEDKRAAEKATMEQMHKQNISWLQTQEEELQKRIVELQKQQLEVNKQYQLDRKRQEKFHASQLKSLHTNSVCGIENCPCMKFDHRENGNCDSVLVQSQFGQKFTKSFPLYFPLTLGHGRSAAESRGLGQVDVFTRIFHTGMSNLLWQTTASFELKPFNWGLCKVKNTIEVPSNQLIPNSS